MEIKSSSVSQTQKIAKNLAKKLKGGDVIALFGDLGSGKTIFVQGLASGLGIKRRITSPTFVFMRSYDINCNGQPLTFYHLDLYRSQNLNDLKTLGLDEIFNKNSIVVLEWADKIKNSLPKARIDVQIRTIDEKTRKITLVGN